MADRISRCGKSTSVIYTLSRVVFIFVQPVTWNPRYGDIYRDIYQA